MFWLIIILLGVLKVDNTPSKRLLEIGFSCSVQDQAREEFLVPTKRKAITVSARENNAAPR
jgi:hypothetical protein